jgi:hypothetical protein
MPDASDDYYFSLGRMICRAAEAEALLESLAADLHPEEPRGTYSGANAQAVAEAILDSADRWAGQERQLRALVEVMRAGADQRNWLVHGWVMPIAGGDGVELQKPVRNRDTWGRRRIVVAEVDLLAARFSWVLDAVVRVVNEHDWEVQSIQSAFAEPLSDPPPLPAFTDPSLL